MDNATRYSRPRERFPRTSFVEAPRLSTVFIAFVATGLLAAGAMIAVEVLGL